MITPPTPTLIRLIPLPSTVVIILLGIAGLTMTIISMIWLIREVKAIQKLLENFRQQQ